MSSSSFSTPLSLLPSILPNINYGYTYSQSDPFELAFSYYHTNLRFYNEVLVDPGSTSRSRPVVLKITKVYGVLESTL